MTDDKRIEALEGSLSTLGEAVEASVKLMEVLGARMDALEEGYAELISEGAEEDFMEERQRWIDDCRERAADKRRTS